MTSRVLPSRPPVRESGFGFASLMGVGTVVDPDDLRIRWDLNPPGPLSRWVGTPNLETPHGGRVVHCVPDGRILAEIH